jgi:antitoxin component of MazEF toxin-antitoxin module
MRVRSVKRRKKHGRRAQALDALLAGITEKNCHGEIDFGRPIGKEREILSELPRHG